MSANMCERREGLPLEDLPHREFWKEVDPPYEPRDILFLDQYAALGPIAFNHELAEPDFDPMAMQKRLRPVTLARGEEVYPAITLLYNPPKVERRMGDQYADEYRQLRLSFNENQWTHVLGVNYHDTLEEAQQAVAATLQKLRERRDEIVADSKRGQIGARLDYLLQQLPEMKKTGSTQKESLHLVAESEQLLAKFRWRNERDPWYVAEDRWGNIADDLLHGQALEQVWAETKTIQQRWGALQESLLPKPDSEKRASLEKFIEQNFMACPLCGSRMEKNQRGQANCPTEHSASQIIDGTTWTKGKDWFQLGRVEDGNNAVAAVLAAHIPEIRPEEGGPSRRVARVQQLMGSEMDILRKKSLQGGDAIAWDSRSGDTDFRVSRERMARFCPDMLFNRWKRDSVTAQRVYPGQEYSRAVTAAKALQATSEYTVALKERAKKLSSEGIFDSTYFGQNGRELRSPMMGKRMSAPGTHGEPPVPITVAADAEQIPPGTTDRYYFEWPNSASPPADQVPESGIVVVKLRPPFPARDW